MDIEKLLAPRSEESPCGEDLSYDNAMMALETKRQGTEEQQYGDTVIPAEEPDWREVKKDAQALLKRTIDLRLAAYLGEAALHTEGITGFVDGIHLVREMLSRYWEESYPLLVDEDGEADPDFRLNAANLFADQDAFNWVLRKSPILENRMIGSFSLRDIRSARGEKEMITDSEYIAPEASLVAAAFRESDKEALKGVRDAAAQAAEDLESIVELFREKLDQMHTPDYNQLVTSFQQIAEVITGELAADEGADGLATAGGEGGAMTNSGASAVSAPGSIGSREDVTRVLDAICRYYQKNEPSSPVPMLLQRAKSLVHKNFIDIVQDLAPQGLDQARAFVGNGSAGTSDWESAPAPSSGNADSGMSAEEMNKLNDW